MGFLFLFPLTLCSASLYDFQRTSVHSVNSFNFEKQVTAQRSRIAAVVHFYRQEDDGSFGFVEEMNALAKDWQGAFVLAAVDCGEEEILCEEQEIRDMPTLKIYPPYPGPSHIYEGAKTSKSLLHYLSSYFSPHISEVTESSLSPFTSARPSTPKVLLFTDKPTIPTIYKALSTVLSHTLDFGIVHSEEMAVLERFNVTKVPKIVLVSAEGRGKEYEGELKYRPIFEFLNVDS